MAAKVVPVDETLDLAAKVAGASPRTTPRRSTNDELQGFVKKTTKRRDSRTEWRVDAKEGIGVRIARRAPLANV